MTTNAYHRDILALLRDDYGVIDARLSHGGNHPSVDFTYAGRARHLTLNRTGGQSTSRLKVRDVRALLGDPPPRPERQRRTMEEMMLSTSTLSALAKSAMSQLTVAAPTATNGRVAIYTGRVRFEVPPAIAEAFGATKSDSVGVSVRRIDDELWEVNRVDRSRPALRWRGASSTYEFDAMSPSVHAGAPSCGLSPAEYLLEDGVILVRCPIATRVPLASNSGKQHNPRRKLAQAAAQDLVAILEVSEEPKIKVYHSDAVVTADEIRDTLAKVRWIEATTPYRLGRRKETGAWCFSAPRIE